MKLREVFATDVTRDIPPVVYFHEQDPEKLEDEVSEYIITGGYPEDHPHSKRVPRGIHEHFVKLLTRIRESLDASRGPELPTSWISGFYGSGKSSFAKLLGLSLDGVELPDGTKLSQRLLKRDTSPKADEFREAWDALQAQIDPASVVFDLGATARGSESVHSAVVRKVQERLGYCPTHDPNVADAELKIERNGDWDQFSEAVAEELGARWEDVRDREFVEDDFSRVLHRMYPERFEEPLAWVDSRIGTASEGRSAAEAVDDIEDMLDHRAPGKTLFIVVDEVSQYIHDNHERMLKLQSFASSLGERLQGRAWLLVTGQEKLEEEGEATVVGRLKDRFPPKFRVHLDATNIRDVVHKRLLRKDSAQRETLKELFDDNAHNLRNYAFQCEDITEEDFLEVYPLLPNHIDLLMEITSAMRARSTRTQGDDHAIRGLMQMLGELFREQELADAELGRLVALDDIYEVQSSALSNDTQNTMARVLDYTATEGDELAERAAKAVALLQLIQDEEPTSVETVAKCLYDRLDRGDIETDVEAALDRLRSENLLTYSEQHGYKLQSSAGQEWMNERKDIGVSYDDASELVRDRLKFLVDGTYKPGLKGARFEWKVYFSDGRHADDEVIKNSRSQAVAPVDFRLVGKEERRTNDWIQKTDGPLDDRFVWVVGRSDNLIQTAREWGRARTMVNRYEARRESLEPEGLRLLSEEQARVSRLKKELSSAVEEAWMRGSIYFQGTEIDPKDHAGGFSDALHHVVDSRLSKLYQYFETYRVSERELEQLLDKSLAGVSQKFLETNIGIVSMDAGSHSVTCEGEIPRRILGSIEESGGGGGSALLEEFEGMPYGYHRSLIQACLAGLLRAGKIEIQPQGGQKITSYRDPGTKDLLGSVRELRAASFMPAGTGPVSARDRESICNFFEQRLDQDVAREDEAIADAVFNTFPALAKRHETLMSAFGNLPAPVTPPSKLDSLGEAIRSCTSSRQIQPTVERVKQQLDTLNSGVQLLNTVKNELLEPQRRTLRDAYEAVEHEFAQLDAVDEADAESCEAAEQIQEVLTNDHPWRSLKPLEEAAESLRDRYRTVRRGLLEKQGEVAENARNELKQRAGYAEISPDESNKVLRPIAKASVDTDTKSKYPALAKIQTAIEVRIPEALADAHDRLDEILENDKPVRKVRSRLRNRTIESEEELEAVLEDLEERANEHLTKGEKVRFV